jgi:fermentation-respiration switch protein FrsA (DUF1100 family)
MIRIGSVLLLIIWLAVAGCVSPPISPPGSSSSLQALETALLFHPVTATESWLVPPPNERVEDVRLRTADGVRIHAWWFPCQDSHGAVLFCHGNAGNLSHWTPLMVALRNTLGLSILIIDYPGYGHSEGTPSEAGCYAAADVAYDWLIQAQGLPPSEIVLMGESLGGGVATDLAVRRSHRALVLVKTFTSIPEMARKQAFTSASASLVRNRFDNLAKIGRCRSPILIAHGDRDRVIPLSEGQKLYAAAPQPKEFLLLEGCNHNDPYPAEFFAVLARFVSLTRTPARAP